MIDFYLAVCAECQCEKEALEQLMHHLLDSLFLETSFHMALFVIWPSNQKFDNIKKLSIFEMGLMSRIQKYKNFQNRTMDFYFLPF